MDIWNKCLSDLGEKWPGKKFVKKFVAGENMEDAFRVAQSLNIQGLEAIINFLGEEVNDRQQARENVEFYSGLIEEIWRRKLQARVSVKPSQLGLKIDRRFYWFQLISVARDAYLYRIPIEIDIETEETAPSVIKNTVALAGHYPGLKLRQAVAMNFKESFDFLQDLTLAKIPVRLCKGAYASEYSEKKVRERFISAAIYLANHDANPDFATHDLALIYLMRALKEKYHNPFGFQFLLGLRKKWWQKLATDGERVGIYVPFGTNWLPYAKRRWKYIIRKIPSMIADAF